MPLFAKHSKTSVWIAALPASIAGVLHLFPSALSHLTPFPPLETAFFVAIGIAQLIWAFEFKRSNTKKKYQLGLALNGGAVVLWVLTRTLVAPFSTGPEHIGLLDTTVLILEIISVIGLMSWYHAIKQRVANVMAGALIIILISGFSFYGGARSLELAFPDRESAHGHSEEDAHEDEGPHEEIEEVNTDQDTAKSVELNAESNQPEEGVKRVEKKTKKKLHNNDDGHHD